jgi:hypothetical protein
MFVNMEERIKFISMDDTLDGKIRKPVVLKCLSLTIGILPFEKANESMLPNLIMPSLNIIIDSLGLFNNLYVYFQTVVFDGL